MSGDANQEVVREAVSELALRRLWMSNKRRRRKRLMIDVDGLPVQVHGQQPGSSSFDLRPDDGLVVRVDVSTRHRFPFVRFLMRQCDETS